jgi:hypothetical protein
MTISCSNCGFVLEDKSGSGYPCPKCDARASWVSDENRVKCQNCFKIILEEDLVDGACPVCQKKDMLHPMCKRDHMFCIHEIIETIAFCPDCGKAICPDCGSHDVYQVSRVTGYLSDVSGWASGKLQELKDRQHYDVGNPASSQILSMATTPTKVALVGEREGN